MHPSSLSGMGNEQAFMAAAAQIIPVLVLALLADPTRRRAAAAQSTVVLSALVVGVLAEAYALVAILREGIDYAVQVVSFGMGFISFAIILPHVLAHTETITVRIPPFVRYAIGRTTDVLIAIPAASFLIVSFYPYAWVLLLMVILWLTAVITAVRAILTRRKWYLDHKDQLRFKAYIPEEQTALDRWRLERQLGDMGLPVDSIVSAADRRRLKRSPAPEEVNRTDKEGDDDAVGVQESGDSGRQGNENGSKEQADQGNDDSDHEGGEEATKH